MAFEEGESESCHQVFNKDACLSIKNPLSLC